MSRYLLLSLLLLLSACSEPPPAALRIATNPWPGYEYLYLAEELKLFAAQGVDVQILQFSSLSDARRAYERGQVDGFGGTLVEVLVAKEQSQRTAQIVHVTDYSNGGDLIVAQATIDDVAQLQGKTVALEPGTLNAFILSRALNRAGLTLDQVKRVSLAQTDMFTALQKGEIDAAVSYPPHSIEMFKQLPVKQLFSSREIPGEVLDIIAIDARVIATRKADIQAMLRGLEAAHSYAQAHPEEAFRIMAEREKISPQEFRTAVENDLKILRSADQAAYFDRQGLLLSALKNTQAVLLASGELSKTTDLAALIAE
ncbi:MAG: ABC transporter substrate-binding protein [Pseudomonadaceae bacterium]|nr:ABC transporter substrate-binding protein [Pseudomonadaceae bacterium]